METNAFSWLIANRLAACVNPSVGQQAAAELRTGGIRLLINLHEKPDPPELLAELGAETLHLPVASTYAPSQAQLDLGIAAIRDALQRGRPVAVHCASGLGRTGTLLAAFLVSQGATAEEAIEWVRSVRPGSVETLEQEQAIYAYAQRVGCSDGGRRGSGGPSQQERVDPVDRAARKLQRSPVQHQDPVVSTDGAAIRLPSLGDAATPPGTTRCGT